MESALNEKIFHYNQSSVSSWNFPVTKNKNSHLHWNPNNSQRMCFSCDVRKAFFPGTRPASSWPVALMVSHLLYEPRHRAASSHLQTAEVVMYWKQGETVSWIICLSSSVGCSPYACSVWVTSKSARQPFTELHRTNGVIYRHVAGSQLWGTPYSAQNINTHVSEQPRIKGRLRVGWLMCCADAWLRVVNQEGETPLGLCDPLIRTSPSVPQRNWFTLSSVSWKDQATITLTPIQ